METAVQPIPTLPRSRPLIRPTAAMLLGVHVAALLGVVYLGWSWSGAALAVGAYFLRMIIVTATYHRYFSHKAFKTSRVFQFILALLAQTSAQSGVLWWASHHRTHHRYSDTPKDVHSAKLRGFWYSHWGWILRGDCTTTNPRLVDDLYRYPELRFLNRPYLHVLPTVTLAVTMLLIGGLPTLVWGYFVSTVLLWHGSFCINSLTHIYGKKRYPTKDESRNSLILAILTTGEGWHNNHHYFPRSARQGFHWYEVDITYYVLRMFAWTGLIWDLREPPRAVIESTLTANSAALDSQRAQNA